jgi:S1-C subfamily serine protease
MFARGLMGWMAVGFVILTSSISRARESDDIYRAAVPSVVWIRNHLETSVITGTGFVVSSDLGLIVTNHHVVQRESTVDVYFPFPNGQNGWETEKSFYTNKYQELSRAGYRATGRLVAYDPELDLAILQVKTKPKNLRQLKIAAADPKPTDTLHVVGNPADRNLWRYCAAIEPRISRVRTSAKNGEDSYNYKSIAMTSSLFGGNSGGPLLNRDGEVVGVISRAGGNGGKNAIAIHWEEIEALVKTLEVQKVFSIQNPTNEVIYYSIQYDDGDWTKRSVQAKSTKIHWIRSKGDTPVPSVRFDGSNQQGIQWKQYKLETFSALIGRNVEPTVEDDAYEYVLRWNQQELELHKK